MNLNKKCPHCGEKVTVLKGRCTRCGEMLSSKPKNLHGLSFVDEKGFAFSQERISNIFLNVATEFFEYTNITPTQKGLKSFAVFCEKSSTLIPTEKNWLKYKKTELYCKEDYTIS